MTSTDTTTEDPISKAVRLRQAYLACVRSGTQTPEEETTAATNWLNAESALTDSDYIQYQKRWRWATVVSETTTVKTIDPN